jgi:hypothetical protein
VNWFRKPSPPSATSATPAHAPQQKSLAESHRPSSAADAHLRQHLGRNAQSTSTQQRLTFGQRIRQMAQGRGGARADAPMTQAGPRASSKADQGESVHPGSIEDVQADPSADDAQQAALAQVGGGRHFRPQERREANTVVAQAFPHLDESARQLTAEALMTVAQLRPGRAVAVARALDEMDMSRVLAGQLPEAEVRGSVQNDALAAVMLMARAGQPGSDAAAAVLAGSATAKAGKTPPAAGQLKAAAMAALPLEARPPGLTAVEAGLQRQLAATPNVSLNARQREVVALAIHQAAQDKGIDANRVIERLVGYDMGAALSRSGLQADDAEHLAQRVLLSLARAGGAAPECAAALLGGATTRVGVPEMKVIAQATEAMDGSSALSLQQVMDKARQTKLVLEHAASKSTSGPKAAAPGLGAAWPDAHELKAAGLADELVAARLPALALTGIAAQSTPGGEGPGLVQKAAIAAFRNGLAGPDAESRVEYANARIAKLGVWEERAAKPHAQRLFQDRIHNDPLSNLVAYGAQVLPQRDALPEKPGFFKRDAVSNAARHAHHEARRNQKAETKEKSRNSIDQMADVIRNLGRNNDVVYADKLSLEVPDLIGMGVGMASTVATAGVARVTVNAGPAAGVGREAAVELHSDAAGTEVFLGHTEDRNVKLVLGGGAAVGVPGVPVLEAGGRASVSYGNAKSRTEGLSLRLPVVPGESHEARNARMAAVVDTMKQLIKAGEPNPVMSLMALHPDLSVGVVKGDDAETAASKGQKLAQAGATLRAGLPVPLTLGVQAQSKPALSRGSARPGFVQVQTQESGSTSSVQAYAVPGALLTADAQAPRLRAMERQTVVQTTIDGRHDASGTRKLSETSNLEEFKRLVNANVGPLAEAMVARGEARDTGAAKSALASFLAELRPSAATTFRIAYAHDPEASARLNAAQALMDLGGGSDSVGAKHLQRAQAAAMADSAFSPSAIWEVSLGNYSMLSAAGTAGHQKTRGPGELGPATTAAPAEPQSGTYEADPARTSLSGVGTVNFELDPARKAGAVPRS